MIEFGIDIRHDLSREEVYHILTSEPNPDTTIYPRTRTQSSGAYRQFQPSWLKQYPWLHYSKHADGVFCRACAFFAPEKVGGRDPGQFVNKPFKSWVKRSEKMEWHAKLEYHATALSRLTEFLARYQQPAMAIHAQFDKELQQRMEDNLAVVESLFSIVMFCGKQGLPLRGHRDDCIVWDREDTVNANQGNFLELVRFRAETDEVLRKHLANAPRNARYTSKTIQNDLINIIGGHIQGDILDEIKQAKLFSVIADEVTDTSNLEQLSICIRYVFDMNIRELFLDFVPVERITGKVLAEAITNRLNAWGLPLRDLRGQCYDGSANMSGARSGCRAIIQQSAPKAVYFHCAAHQLNLAVVAACKIQVFRSTESTIGEVARFFAFSAKRQRLLDKALEVLTTEAHAKKLKDACRTRWVQRIDAYTIFTELLPVVHIVLQAMTCPTRFPELGLSWNWDSDTVTKANGFLYQFESSSFLISLKILLEVFSYIRVLTLKLQMEALDVSYAYSQVDLVISTIEGMREKSDVEFQRIFAEAVALGKKVHGEEFEITLPRINRRQTHRANVATTSPEVYYRVSLYNEFLSHVASELKERFCEKPVQIIGLLELLPSKCIQRQIEDTMPASLHEAVTFYSDDLPSPVLMATEYRMWVRKWQSSTSQSDLPKKLIDLYRQCEPLAFPNIIVLLRIALTLPNIIVLLRIPLTPKLPVRAREVSAS